MKPVRVRYVILDVHMGLGRDGLREIIRRQKKANHLFAQALKGSNELILFLNKARDKAKLFSESGKVLGYLILDRGERITEKSLDLIPQTFGGSIEYGSAVRDAIAKLDSMDSGRKTKIDLKASARLAS